MSKTVAFVTATALVLVVIAWVASPNGPPVPSHAPSDYVAMLLILATSGAYLVFAFRPRRWLSVVLFVVSLLAAALAAWALWIEVSFFHGHFDFTYAQSLVAGRREWVRLSFAIIFPILALLWGVLCYHFRDIAATDLTRRCS
jgi:hypothetical protein